MLHTLKLQVTAAVTFRQLNVNVNTVF